MALHEPHIAYLMIKERPPTARKQPVEGQPAPGKVLTNEVKRLSVAALSIKDPAGNPDSRFPEVEWKADLRADSEPSI